MVSASAPQGTRTTPVMGWGIEQLEYEARVARVRRELEWRELGGLVLFHPIRMAYLCGFFHYSTERPMVIFSPGANTVQPHGLLQTRGLQRGDVLVTGAGADVGGYNSELERTMIIGEPTPEFEHDFARMLQLQQTAFDAIRPGRTLGEVETEVSAAFAELGVAELQRHHSEARGDTAEMGWATAFRVSLLWQIRSKSDILTASTPVEREDRASRRSRYRCE
jgi:Xaa-Pro aminopeptidase